MKVEAVRKHRPFDVDQDAENSGGTPGLLRMDAARPSTEPVFVDQQFDSAHLWRTWVSGQFGNVGNWTLGEPLSLSVSFIKGRDLGAAQLTGNIERLDFCHLAPEESNYFVLAMHSGPLRWVSQDGRTTAITDNDLVLLDLRKPFQYWGSAAASNQLAFFLDAEQAEALIPGVSDGTARQIPTRKGWGAHLAAYLRGLTPKALLPLLSGDTQHHRVLSEHILALLGNALHEAARTPEATSLPERLDGERPEWNLRRKVLEWLQENYHDERLSLASVAKAFSISTRHLHRTFSSSEGLSFLNALHRIRAENAARILTEEYNLPIAEVGMLCGMPNLSTFYRIFHKVFGATPKQYRKQFRTALAQRNLTRSFG